ncbi:hypothetical protein [Bradyrhizobium elkanii]|uniref:Uncharacterized protein n=1 Tax=Bradyrhizobium elkanii TaxID=29448 RepID=A0A8I1YIR8_BRAEL|nr:hypothetical protein [Bradyrhizobium elkanii]MBP1297138.1 hypothetical protein [Bradyrhizobium elkanii]MCS3577358.1 hypothetical protein [Bradyrhizobium elkanii]MCS3720234.1 hypothetical protein [Bradyrhizobium elkanii]MCS3881184.1 hypothetical protein [Bradyrhizobium elkanii]MCS4004651.1 hypothetical protein [Bradyrhizobium elkanii USDA 61]
MDKAITKAKAIWAKAKAIFATKIGKALAALLILAAIISYTHHRGVVSTSAKFTAQVEQLKQQLADASAKPAPVCLDQEPDAGTAERLKQAETAKAALEKKVKDYEKQLGRRPAKAGGFILSPADARSLQNIR